MGSLLTVRPRFRRERKAGVVVCFEWVWAKFGGRVVRFHPIVNPRTEIAGIELQIGGTQSRIEQLFA